MRCCQELCAGRCVNGFLSLRGAVPVGFPLIGVNKNAKLCHAIDAAYAPSGTRLLQSSADHVLAGTLDLAPADRLPSGEATWIVELVLAFAEVLLQGPTDVARRFKSEHVLERPSDLFVRQECLC
jgi:hypothetical protein